MIASVFLSVTVSSSSCSSPSPSLLPPLLSSSSASSSATFRPDQLKRMPRSARSTFHISSAKLTAIGAITRVEAFCSSTYRNTTTWQKATMSTDRTEMPARLRLSLRALHQRMSACIARNSKNMCRTLTSRLSASILGFASTSISLTSSSSSSPPPMALSWSPTPCSSRLYSRQRPSPICPTLTLSGAVGVDSLSANGSCPFVTHASSRCSTGIHSRCSFHSA
mmetsp:Transcript_12247/g.37752  ORF Transcript_12247/g.37752 Transcript_12247/m.37752 type:complete len:223 (+) Transcript_12247:485-1153(+)